MVGTSKLEAPHDLSPEKGLNGRWKVARNTLSDANICAREKVRVRKKKVLPFADGYGKKQAL
jgi:hypothetical protein